MPTETTKPYKHSDEQRAAWRQHNQRRRLLAGPSICGRCIKRPKMRDRSVCRQCFRKQLENGERAEA